MLSYLTSPIVVQHELVSGRREWLFHSFERLNTYVDVALTRKHSQRPCYALRVAMTYSYRLVLLPARLACSVQYGKVRDRDSLAIQSGVALVAGDYLQLIAATTCLYGV